jgi:hypothetical protein
MAMSRVVWTMNAPAAQDEQQGLDAGVVGLLQGGVAEQTGGTGWPSGGEDVTPGHHRRPPRWPL